MLYSQKIYVISDQFYQNLWVLPVVSLVFYIRCFGFYKFLLLTLFLDVGHFLHIIVFLTPVLVVLSVAF